MSTGRRCDDCMGDGRCPKLLRIDGKRVRCGDDPLGNKHLTRDPCPRCDDDQACVSCGGQGYIRDDDPGPRSAA